MLDHKTTLNSLKVKKHTMRIAASNGIELESAIYLENSRVKNRITHS